MILTEEGYVTLAGTTPTYYYYIKDHQGNNRVVINQSGAVQQANHYYPFGGLFGEGVQTVNQPYKYNGKEIDKFQNLDMYDYGARHYDAALGRWFTGDPLAEKYYNISPYVYVANNPVRYVDPDGRDIWLYDYDKSGKLLEKLQYKPGMKYKGNNTYFSNTTSILNQMNSIENGGTILSELHGSKNVFEITNQASSTEGTRQLIEKNDGGAIMNIGKDISLEAMAHETFHAYQYEMGQGGASIFNEVEAYLFGYSVALQDALDNSIPFPSGTSTGTKNNSGIIYEKSFMDLLERYSKVNFDRTVSNFKDGSEKNRTGIYNNYSIRRANQKVSLIKNFDPLIKY